MNKIAVFIFLLLAAALITEAEIIVKQDKNGNLTITNDYASSGKSNKKYIKSKSNGVTFYKSPSSKVPTKYILKVRRLSKKHGVKETLVLAVIRAESAFNPFAVSKKGAVGLMQLMQDTAQQYGVVNRYNEDQNLDAGIRHLKYLLGKYNNDLPLTLAAYNAGEEAVKRYKGVPPYKETKGYIKRVMSFMGMSYEGFGSYFASKSSSRIYQYRTKDGKIMITDSFPTNAAEGTVTVIE